MAEVNLASAAWKVVSRLETENRGFREKIKRLRAALQHDDSILSLMYYRNRSVFTGELNSWTPEQIHEAITKARAILAATAEGAQ